MSREGGESNIGKSIKSFGVNGYDDSYDAILFWDSGLVYADSEDVLN